MHVSKRHKPLRLDDQQARPMGGNAGDGVDLISCLPDAILGTIVSLLPTKDGARTQALSRRWLPLWCSHMAPLNLVADHDLSRVSLRSMVVSKILSDHPGPARRFSLDLVSRADFLAKVAAWFRSTSLDGLQELKVTDVPMPPVATPPRPYPLPPHALTRFAPTLRVLNLYGCQFPDLAAPPSFPLLDRLIMYDVRISRNSLQSMISGSVVLKSVSLHYMGFDRLCINSLTLRSISFYPPVRTKGVTIFRELVIEEAPCLERLLPIFPGAGPTTIRVNRAPKLEVLGFLSEGVSTLHLGTMLFQNMIAVSLTTKIRTIKILAIDIGANLDAVVDFLKCFPCLEKLYIISDQGKDLNNVRKYDPLDPIECFELHLKKVVLKNYSGDKRAYVEFAQFFILNAKVLQEMQIGVLNRESGTWMPNQHSQLQLENRASQDAQIALRSDLYAMPTNHGHTHDLSVVDPFEKSMCGYNKSYRYI
ncbi:unnamed protein product [Alopecurus aequalis]